MHNGFCINSKSKMEHCKECEGNLIGRIDKKFCSDGCRNAYHNRIYREECVNIRKVNRILARNHKVLRDLMDNNVRECPKERLTEQGFNFSFFTSFQKKPGEGKYFLCYDIEYFCSEDQLMYITQNKLLKK